MCPYFSKNKTFRKAYLICLTSNLFFVGNRQYSLYTFTTFTIKLYHIEYYIMTRPSCFQIQMSMVVYNHFTIQTLVGSLGPQSNPIKVQFSITIGFFVQVEV